MTFSDRRIGFVILALILGGLLTLGALLGYMLSSYLVLERHGDAKSVQFGPERLKLMLGVGEAHAQGIVITGPDPEQGFAQVSSMTQPMQATQLGELHWRIDGLHDSTEVELLWVDQSRNFHRLPLEHGGRSQGRLMLADVPDWQGVIIGIGLLVNGSLDSPLTVRELTLRPVLPEPTVLPRQLWRQWTIAEGWQSHSINLIAGGAGVLIGPTPIVALWVTLSSLSYLLLAGRPSPGRHLAPLGLIVLTGWLVLDLRWQWNLGEQWGNSLEQLTGKNTIEKLRTYDEELIDLISSVKRILPKQPVRIFLVSDFSDATGSARHNRVRYHLTPHNVYGFSTEPPLPRWTRSGDYLLALLPLQGVRYRRIPGDEALSWDDHELSVELLLAEHQSLLFRIGAVP